MNKKFSTLVAAFLAATSFGASAQTLVDGAAPNANTICWVRLPLIQVQAIYFWMEIA